MNEEVKGLPELSSDQKLRIVLAHRDYIKADAESRFAEQTKQKSLQRLSDTLDEVGLELGLKGMFQINLDTLLLSEIPAPESK